MKKWNGFLVAKEKMANSGIVFWLAASLVPIILPLASLSSFYRFGGDVIPPICIGILVVLG